MNIAKQSHINIEILSDFDLSCALIASVLHNLIVVNLPSHHIMSNNFRTLTHLEKFGCVPVFRILLRQI